MERKALNNILKVFTTFDMPEKGDLIPLESPSHYSENEILIGNRNFLPYLIAVPYIKYSGDIYFADSKDVTPRELASDICSTRKYIKIEKVETKEIRSDFIYNFD